MAQDGTTAGGASYTLDNVTFPVGRTKLQSIFDAIRSTNIGNDAPDLVAGQFWIDNNTPSTTVWTLYFYDGTDSIQFATIDTINNTVNFIDSTFDLINDTTPELGGDLSLNSNDIIGTGNINITGTVTSDKFTITEGEIEGSSNNFQIQSLVSGIIYDASNGFHTFKDNGTNRFQIRSGGDIYLGYEDTGTTPKLFWDASAESLGIGTSSPSSFDQVGADDLVIGGGASGHGITLYTGTGSSGGIAFADGTTTTDQYRGRLLYAHANDSMRFFTSATERMRIDSSGNVLVSTTDDTPSENNDTGGISLRSNGQVNVSVDGGAGLDINRKTSDGNIAVFRKDGTTVGSIGNQVGDLYIGTGDTGISFFDFGTDNAILPYNTDTGNYADNSLNFGIPTIRWKNAYLSGNIYLGGTTSANALDDYETGTWTPVFEGSTTNPSVTYDTTIRYGTYTKIGRQIYVHAVVRTDAVASVGSGFLRIGGLPFAPSSGFATNTRYVLSVGRTQNFSADINDVKAIVDESVTYMNISEDSGRTSIPMSILVDGANKNQIEISGFYIT